MSNLQPTEIKERYRIIHRWYVLRFLLLVILSCPLMVGLVLRTYSGIAVEIGENMIFLTTQVLLLAVPIGWLWHILTWRCPACWGGFGRNVDPKFCPHCGVELQ